MYHCPECNDGPFEPADWWEHFQTHNTPWLQARDPKNLERTDLGYGEDLKTTTVPTHDLPNEPGFTPEKFGSWDEVDEPHQYAQWLLQKGQTDGFDIKQLFAWISQRLQLDLGLDSGQAHQVADEVVPAVQRMAAIPHAHRMVWLSQPNNDSLKYWHHNPTNTTYAWDSTENRHHWSVARHLGIQDDSGARPLYGNKFNDWDGGFFIQNEAGRHPADLWGLPSQVDYAPIEGDGDYGMSVA